MKTIRISLCQINPTVGDLSGNVQKITNFFKEAKKLCPDIIAFPELSITGYPPEDLILKPQFIKDNLEALKKIQELVDDTIVIVGFIDRRDDIYNSAAILFEGKIIDIYHKVHLPNYGVFDEFRYFQAGNRFPVYEVNDIKFGVNICEDIWYPEGPATVQSLGGAEFIININASPYHIAKSKFRKKMLSSRAFDNNIIIAYLNTVGGQDELVFDGHSLIINQHAEVIAEGKLFEEDIITVDLNLDSVFIKRLHDPRRRQLAIAQIKEKIEKIDIKNISLKKERTFLCPKPFSIPKKAIQPELDEDLEIYKALTTGTKDYVYKNGFKKVCVGLSGGVDSALVATVAVDAIGKENVIGIFMPSPYTSNVSREDVYALSTNLGIQLIEVPITPIFNSYKDTLSGKFSLVPSEMSMKEDTTEENIQARIRGNILMAFSNKFGWLVLTTGNKSEMSVGYATLYGDMAGGFAVLKDVPKTLVYKLCKWKNKSSKKIIIPERTIQREPTAELKPDQKDTDVLPPYEILDPILKAYVEEDKSFEEIVEIEPKCEINCIKEIIKMIDLSEYKRRQSPPGIKITPRAFGKDRRFPITNKYRSW
ncbi:MAG: NAD+ synthase [Thermodesulfovibrionales bacterium]|nr:NAD+ synthase [Thermodesulfovibrionales bacterium]